MVDACMRFLNATGWLNFRMRSMLVSFASYHLWLPWQMTGTYLARRFLDYEPGIHYNQLQMQSGVTGINAIRIYAPTKQALDQDPEGTFIRRWVPELENLPLRWLAEPHHIDMIDRHQSGFVPGESYPCPSSNTARLSEPLETGFSQCGEPMRLKLKRKMCQTSREPAQTARTPLVK